MFIDSSALVALLANEPDQQRIAAAIQAEAVFLLLRSMTLETVRPQDGLNIPHEIDLGAFLGRESADYARPYDNGGNFVSQHGRSKECKSAQSPDTARFDFPGSVIEIAAQSICQSGNQHDQISFVSRAVLTHRFDAKSKLPRLRTFRTLVLSGTSTMHSS